MSAAGGGRAFPFHCPYCGDENLRPHEPEEGSGHGEWECHACLRAFGLRFLGLVDRSHAASAHQAAVAAPHDTADDPAEDTKEAER